MALWHLQNIADVDYGCLPMSSLSCCCTASSSSWASVALSVASWFGVSGAIAGELTPTRSVQIISCFSFLALLIRLSSLNSFRITDDCFAKDADTEFASNIRSATDLNTMQVQVLGETALQGPVCPISMSWIPVFCYLVCYVLLIFFVSLYLFIFYFLQNSF